MVGSGEELSSLRTDLGFSRCCRSRVYFLCVLFIYYRGFFTLPYHYLTNRLNLSDGTVLRFGLQIFCIREVRLRAPPVTCHFPRFGRGVSCVSPVYVVTISFALPYVPSETGRDVRPTFLLYMPRCPPIAAGIGHAFGLLNSTLTSTCLFPYSTLGSGVSKPRSPPPLPLPAKVHTIVSIT